MTAEEYLKEEIGGYDVRTIFNNLLDEQILELIQDYAEHYHTEKLKELLPSDEEIERNGKTKAKIEAEGSRSIAYHYFLIGSHFVINKLKP